MPVKLTERELRDTIAVMGEWDRDGAREAQSALEWLGWEGEGSLLLRRYDVQLFVWYTLPRKFLTSLEFKREAAEMLASTLERLGGRAASYAEVCRSVETYELLCELDELLRRLRLTRRRGRQILTTARGRKLQADPPTRLLTIATKLLVGEDFRAACAELAVALILDGAGASYSDTLADHVHPAIAAEGWHAEGQSPDLRDIRWTIADFLRPAEAIGLLQREESSSRLRPDPLTLTDVGRAALIAGLRERALAPATRPY